MDEHPLEQCPQCHKKLVYFKSKQKKNEVDIEAICLGGHKITFTISNKIRTTYKELIRERIFSCAICGGSALPDYENSFKKVLNKTSFRIKCKDGCNDTYLREFEKELPKKCPKCGAPLKIEELEKLKNQEIIECSACGFLAKYSY